MLLNAFLNVLIEIDLQMRAVVSDQKVSNKSMAKEKDYLHLFKIKIID